MKTKIRNIKNLFSDQNISGSILYHMIHGIFVTFYAYGIEEKRYMDTLRVLRNLNYSLVSQTQRFYQQFHNCLELKKIDYGRSDDPYRYLNFIPSLKASFERASKMVIVNNKNWRLLLIELKKRYDELTLENPNAEQKAVIKKYLSNQEQRDNSKARIESAPYIIDGQKADKEILENKLQNFDVETQLKNKMQEVKEIDIKQYKVNATHSLIDAKLQKQKEEPDQVNKLAIDINAGKKSIKVASNGQSSNPKEETIS